jgi:hypothetical protein
MVDEPPEQRASKARAIADAIEEEERVEAQEAAAAQVAAEAEEQARVDAETAAAEAEAEEQAIVDAETAAAEAEAEEQARVDAETAAAEAEADEQAIVDAETAAAEAEAEEQARVDAETAAAEAEAEEQARVDAETAAAEAEAEELARVDAENMAAEAEAQAEAEAEANAVQESKMEAEGMADERANTDTVDSAQADDITDVDDTMTATEESSTVMVVDVESGASNESDDFVHVDASQPNVEDVAESGNPDTDREIYTDTGAEDGVGYDDERDNEDEEFIDAGDAAIDFADEVDQSPELRKKLTAAEADLTKSRAQQQQLQSQLAAVRSECGILRDDLERSEEAAETVQEVSAETMAHCSQLEEQLREVQAQCAQLKVDAAGAGDLRALLDAAQRDIEAKDSLIASDLDEIKRYQGLVEASKKRADDSVKNAATESEALVGQLGEAREEANRLRLLFDGKELELRDANAMSLDATSRAVTAETRVDEVVQVNDDLLRQLKTSQGQLDAAKTEAESALLMRETQIVEQEQLVEAAEKKIVTLEETLRKLNTSHDELQVKSAGDRAALQARVDRKTAELEQLTESRDAEDTEKEDLRAKMAATQSHAVQVQKAALKYVVIFLARLG